ncbi:MAG: PIN domain-containing protein [Xanthomonadales bacterium]|nr:PIN domain-containing protein [Xanthomonadales bacterium]MCB1629513.1 PIN domain-containing protein [Xanthomonadales bacterium]MCB1634416.1 PIN domain-containing protein [Xanthomonadales bacterium]MCB1640443.1 PIN domain-containing protein [Xanthomonadales bacterium]
MRSFLDTNVLVYADAADEPIRQGVAIELIRRHRKDATGVISTQVLQEFANVALRKLHLPPPLIRQRLAFYQGFEVVPATPQLITAALDLHVLHSLSLYDALIIRAAEVAACQALLSEDLQHGFSFAGVKVVNPFRTG